MVDSWKDAIKHCSSQSWQDLALEWVNQLGVRVLRLNRERYNEWNHVVDSLRPTVEQLVQRKTVPVLTSNSLPQEFTGSVRGDIFGILMEAEYSDICPEPGPFAALASYYLKGHFPCGWEGDHPKGRLIVY